MSYVDYSQFSFGAAMFDETANKGKGKSTSDRMVNIFEARRQERERLLEPFRRQNRLRKPCPTCNNLVMPHLQQEHDDAYHSPKH
jgi:hypothetical protein